MPNDFGDLLRASPVERSGKLRRLLAQPDLPRALAPWPVCHCALQQALAAFSLLVERLHCRQDLLALR